MKQRNFMPETVTPIKSYIGKEFRIQNSRLVLPEEISTYKISSIDEEGGWSVLVKERGRRLDS